MKKNNSSESSKLKGDCNDNNFKCIKCQKKKKNTSMQLNILLAYPATEVCPCLWWSLVYTLKLTLNYCKQIMIQVRLDNY